MQVLLVFFFKGGIMEDFKGNSNASKERDIKQVASNVKVSEEKQRTKFFASDGKTVLRQVLENVALPGVQKLFTDTAKSAIDWLIYGVKGTTRPSGLSNVSYTNYYDRNRSYSLPTIPSSAYMTKPAVYAVNDVTFMDRGEAEVTLQALKEAIGQYGMVSVGDFYDMIGQKHSFTDCKYGWKDLSSAIVERSRDGYCILFPKVTPIE